LESVSDASLDLTHTSNLTADPAACPVHATQIVSAIRFDWCLLNRKRNQSNRITTVRDEELPAWMRSTVEQQERYTTMMHNVDDNFKMKYSLADLLIDSLTE